MKIVVKRILLKNILGTVASHVDWLHFNLLILETNCKVQNKIFKGNLYLRIILGELRPNNDPLHD